MAQEQQQHLLSYAAPSNGYSANQSSSLKPLRLVVQTGNHYNHSKPEDFETIKQTQQEDAYLKALIRRLRLISRILSFLISIGVLVPITMTLIEFLRTQNTYRTITHLDGTTASRTPWAHDSKVWPTWSYFAVAALSVFFNFVTLFSYHFGVSKANTASQVTSVFSWIVMLGNLVVWIVAVGVYRGEKDKGGKSNDLWGWTCSAGARAIQKEFAGDVDFDKFCGVQSASWYVGLVQVGASLLTVVVYALVILRWRRRRT
ncbi:hypothetical protein N0V94_001016 [Neodidymelliopsis sp. IMI 364377]|nr:hypothetical protein N0V94_001016 [Neodidymelliopsis sp. IMI 364377]